MSRNSTPDRHDQAVTMRWAGWTTLALVAVVALVGLGWVAAGLGLVAGAAVLVLLLAQEVDDRG